MPDEPWRCSQYGEPESTGTGTTAERTKSK
jgi:hypothetical protein